MYSHQGVRRPFSGTAQQDVSGVRIEPATSGSRRESRAYSAMMTPLSLLSHIAHRITALRYPSLQFEAAVKRFLRQQLSSRHLGTGKYQPIPELYTSLGKNGCVDNKHLPAQSL